MNDSDETQKWLAEYLKEKNRLIKGEYGLRHQDRLVFSDAAKRFNKWILVRHTNSESLKYIGRKSVRYGYLPKPIDCKPKTAKRSQPGREQAGLVADPTLVPYCFNGDGDGNRLDTAKALDLWNDFIRTRGVNERAAFNEVQLRAAGAVLQRNVDSGTIRHVTDTRTSQQADVIARLRHATSHLSGARLYRIDLDEASPYYGCLTLNGCYLFGDYDLKDIVDVRRPGCVKAEMSELYGNPHMTAQVGTEFKEIQAYINDRIGVPVVQHHPEVFYAGHTKDEVEVFGPMGENGTLVGEEAIKKWYDIVWHRGTIDLKQQFKEKFVSKIITPPGSTYVARSRGGIALS